MRLIEQILKSVTLAPAIQFGGLGVTPVIRTDNMGAVDYLTLDEALGTATARVVEVSEAGSVPELRFENCGKSAVLLLDGEELVGAKQNRVLNLSILVPAAATLTIPVTCVESGRWQSTSSEFRSESRAFYSRGRARKAAHVTQSMQESGTRRSEQHEVWADIAGKVTRLESPSASGAMAAMYERHEARLDDYVKAFPTSEHQHGAIFSIRGAVRGIEMFDFAATARKLMPKLIQSYALDAIDEAEQDENSDLDELDFLRLLVSAPMREFPSVGEGQDLRYATEAVAGGALAARGRILHLSAFARGATQAQVETRRATGISSASARRRNRARGPGARGPGV